MDGQSNLIARHVMVVATNSQKIIQSREGLMKKILLVSLLLAGIFLIGSSGVALAQCIDYQDYYCNWIGKQYGEIYGIDTDCVTLCYDDGFEVGIDNFGGFGEFYGYLYPAKDNKHLLGTCYDFLGYGWTGCSVETKGSSRLVNLSYIQDGNGYVLQWNCTPCNNCCH